MSNSPVELILIAQIHIANPRPRNRNRWQMMVANIREVGLKKPVTVTRKDHEDDEGRNCLIGIDRSFQRCAER